MAGPQKNILVVGFGAMGALCAHVPQSSEVFINRLSYRHDRFYDPPEE